MERMTVAAKHIGILLFADVEELDVVGPWEVLSWWTRNFPDDGYSVSCFSKSGRAVECAKGLTINAHHSYETVPPLEVLIYPGGRGTRPHLSDDTQLDWLRAQRVAVPVLASVCTGALAFAAAGVLANRPATTYWASTDELAALDPTIDVRVGARFVDDGDVLTSAGVSAGIDMALHMVGRFAGVERAREVRKGIEYDPAPPV